MKLMSELDLSGRRVLIRQDLNVPLREGEITNDARLRAAAPSLIDALNQGAAVIVMSHLGRPVEGQWTERLPGADRGAAVGGNWTRCVDGQRVAAGGASAR